MSVAPLSAPGSGSAVSSSIASTAASRAVCQPLMGMSAATPLVFVGPAKEWLWSVSEVVRETMSEGGGGGGVSVISAWVQKIETAGSGNDGAGDKGGGKNGDGEVAVHSVVGRRGRCFVWPSSSHAASKAAAGALQHRIRVSAANANAANAAAERNGRGSGKRHRPSLPEPPLLRCEGNVDRSSSSRVCFLGGGGDNLNALRLHLGLAKAQV